MNNNTYNLMLDFVDLSSDNHDYISVDPYWVVAVFRAYYPATFDRVKRASFSKDFHEGVRLKPGVFIIQDECSNLQISSTKTSHVGQLSASLYPTMNFMSEIFPGDWVMAWIVYGRDKRDAVVRKLRLGQAVNSWEDGLKFFGKVTNMRKDISQDPNTGHRNVRYSMTAGSFKELDAQVYYNPYLTQVQTQLSQTLANIGGAFANFSKIADDKGVSVGNAITATLQTMLGTGVNRNFSQNKGIAKVRESRATFGTDNPHTGLIPKEVAAVFGKDINSGGSKPNGGFGFIDIMSLLSGVQKYGDYNVGDPREFIFNPVNTRDGNSFRFTGTQMKGRFQPTAFQFHGHTIWTLMHQFLNPAINELYATLRVNGIGQIVPTVVVRQIPFSSEPEINVSVRTNKSGEPILPKNAKEREKVLNSIKNGRIVSKKNGETVFGVPGQPHDSPVTTFGSLPRWVVSPILLFNLSLSRSDAQRFNFVQITGDHQVANEKEKAEAVTRNRPIVDDLDIVRNGIRLYDSSVACADSDTKLGAPNIWMRIASDFLMGQHMTLSGSATILGIQAPIAVGDNLEVDDTVLHIESLTHVCSQSPDGTKSFRTNLNLSYGVAATPQREGEAPRTPLIGHYAAISPDGATARDPAVTYVKPAELEQQSSDGLDPSGNKKE